MKDFQLYKLDYSMLALLAGAFIVYFLLNRQEPYNLVLGTVIFGLLYVVWGIWHHLSRDNLTKSIMLEYFLVAGLGVVLVSSLLL